MDKKGFSFYALLCIFTAIWFAFIVLSMVCISVGIQLIGKAPFNDVALCFFFGILTGWLFIWLSEMVVGAWKDFR